MRILITGGTGLLGSTLLDDPHFQKDEITILSRSGHGQKMRPHVVVERWSPNVLDGWESVLQGQDVIIHLAGENIGEGLWTIKRKGRILESRVDSGETLKNAILAMKEPPGLFLQTSAVGYYGSRGEQSLNEHSARGDGFLSDVCQAWEHSTAAIEEVGVRRVVLRTGVVLTPKGGILPRLSLPIKFFLGGNLGNGKQYIPWLHITDFPGIVRFLIDKADARGVYNLSAPNPVTLETLGKTLAKSLSRPYWFPVPAWGLRLLLGEMSALVLDSQRVYPEKLIDEGYRYQFETIESAIHDFV